MPQVAGLRYHRRAGNGGFIAACNDGAALARGDFLVFLNNDTVPQPGWLDALLRTFDEHPDAGLVGAQLLYPDGRLQEAGGVVFADGSGWNYGRFESAADPRFAYLRDADYASGAAIAIPRALFAQLGGFDTRYAPAYYEDTDLAFAVRAAGKRVLYQPAARVVHDEGATAGTDTGSGIKAYQVRNRERFAEHRQAALQSHPGSGTVPTPAVLHRRQRQVLVIDALTPQPDHDSGSLRLVNLMRLLREEGAHVVFLPANRAHAGRYTEDLQQLGVETWYAPFAQRAPAWLREHGARFDSVLVCRHYVAREFLPLLRRHAPQARDRVRHRRPALPARAARAPNSPATPPCSAPPTARAALELGVIARSDVTAGGERSRARTAGARCAAGAGRSAVQPAPAGRARASRSRSGATWCSSAASAIRRTSMRCAGSCSDVFPLRARAAAGRAVPLHRQPRAGGDRGAGAHPGVVVHGHVADIDAVHGRLPHRRGAAALRRRASRARST